MQTIMITGCSSGFGIGDGALFFERGWKVIATMRAPQERCVTRQRPPAAGAS